MLHQRVTTINLSEQKQTLALKTDYLKNILCSKLPVLLAWKDYLGLVAICDLNSRCH